MREDDYLPALTAEEWEKGVINRPCDAHYNHGLNMDRGIDGEGAPVVHIDANTIEDTSRHHGDTLHAIAAFCLYGQPFGFTHEDVKKLLWIPPDQDTLESVAARIAALLPPEPT